MSKMQNIEEGKRKIHHPCTS